MEALLAQGSAKLPYVEVELSAIGVIAGRWVTIRTESISRDGMFIRCDEYVRPRSSFEVYIWLAGDEPPIHAIVTAFFVERTWSGFGVGAQISAVLPEQRLRWERFYRHAAAAGMPGYREVFQLRDVLRRPRLLAMERALPLAMLDALRENGVAVETVDSCSAALRRLRRGDIDMVVADLRSTEYSGQELCRQVARQGRPPLLVLFTHRAMSGDFESMLYAGASNVIARPCGYETLLGRLLDLLRHGNRPDADPDHEHEDSLGDLVPLAAPVPGGPTLVEQMAARMSTWWMTARDFLRSSALRFSTVTHS